MLNLSERKVIDKNLQRYSAFNEVMELNITKKMTYWVIVFFCLIIGVSMLPWTQSIVAKSKVTTLRPEHRPQSVYSTIAGKIEQWYVREGQFVKKGDTLAFLSEVKADYFDPKLLERTQAQVDAKQSAKDAYSLKNNALAQQLKAITDALAFKLEQTENKVKQFRLKATTDSIEVQAARTAYNISIYQYKRTDTLYQQGIKSLTDVENKRNKMQANQAKLIAYENKYLGTKNQLLNAQIQQNTVQSEYANKLAKVRSERSSALANVYDAESQVAKLENQYASYKKRSSLYYVIAPQDAYITKIYNKGLGELVKETSPLLSIMPANHELAVETYIQPMDYPLLDTGKTVLLVFDGWPAFVFSGWPNQSYGTFKGKIIAIDNVANEKGLYRLLVVPSKVSEKPWPKELRVGTGASASIMLNDVPLWYEFWRQLNGFPPEFYQEQKMEKPKLKAPANNLKK